MRDPIDVHVGQRLRLLRKLKKFSQEALAHEAGVTFQQVQKYENGANRISASKIWVFAGMLGVTPGAFFEGLPRDAEAIDLDQTKALAFINTIEGHRLVDVALRLPPEAIAPHLALMEMHAR